MYADKFHTKSRPSSFLSPEEYRDHVRRFGEDKVTAFEALRAEFGDQDLDRPVRRHGAAALPFAHRPAGACGGREPHTGRRAGERRAAEGPGLEWAERAPSP